MKKWYFSAIIVLCVSFINAQKSEIIDKPYTLKLFLLDECKICWNYMPLLNDLENEYGDIVSFIGYFPNFSSKKKGIEKFRSDYLITYPLQTDYFKKETEKYGIQVTPEVVLIDTKTDAVLYQGRIDDNFVRIGKRRRVITSHELSDALYAVRNNTEIKVKRTESIGCFIDYSDGLRNLQTEN